jgi:prevent-host-death family protein
VTSVPDYNQRRGLSGATPFKVHIQNVGQHGKHGAESFVMQSRAKQQAISRPASDVKGHWRDIVEEVNVSGEVVVTNYNRPAVVVLSMERYAKLKKDAISRDPLAALRAEFDQELAALRQPDAGQKLRKIFAASPAEIAKAANAAGRRKR